ncbi:Leupeptin-inactivating enzyme 2 precursor (LIE2) [Alloactinosynnema sp. L-07]|uniref:M4 family metallopeptidase n=1 Tax=Alloactinosynnema sp. L-07 TaxID=1653480 RepID=UPI00065EFE7D|nr:M4 family metallopeptidase [Alloactinosynnema sp. L-07]CRK58498.1 Leupeptin-inactivating enzyme 2 precursor (LIE2) [Alloactinosynnema sp. L-07]
MKRSLAIMAAATMALATMTVSPTSAAATIPPSVTAQPAAHSAERAADLFVETAPKAVRKSKHDKLRRDKTRSGTDGLKHIAYERTHRGLPVVGGDVVVTVDADNKVRNSIAAQEREIDVDTTAAVDADRARTAARTRLKTVTELGEPRLVVFAVGTPRLAWHTLVAGVDAEGPTRQHVYVDARTGALIDSHDEVMAGTGNGYFSGSNTAIGTSGSGSSYSMVDPTRPGVSCTDQTAKPFAGTDDAWGNGGANDLESACVDVLYAVGQQWSMLSAWLGRDGIDGAGRGFPSRVGLSDVNAYWYGNYAGFGKSGQSTNQITSIDIVGHEFGHAIFQHAGGYGGIAALNEGTGDIFGTLTEYYANHPNDTPDYLIAERANFYGPGAIRNMYNPSLINGDPNCWTSDINSFEPHAGAGVLNHWFYLLAEGSSPVGKPASPICAGGPSSVTGLGQLAAAKVFYNGLMMKTSGWDYGKARTSTLHAARALYPSTCTEFNRVKDAWNAVAVPAQAGEPTCPTTSSTFSVTAASTGYALAGRGSESEVTTAVTSGTSESVTMSATVPSGWTAVFRPAVVPSGEVTWMTITPPSTEVAGNYTVTVRGTNGSEVRTSTQTITVEAATSDDFTIGQATVSAPIRAGTSGSTTFTPTPIGNPIYIDIRWDTANVPGGTSLEFSRDSSLSDSPITATVVTSPSTPQGTYSIPITFAGWFKQHAANLNFTVSPPSEFSMTVTPTNPTVAAGGTATVTVSTAVVQGTAETISFEAGLDSLGTGSSATFTPTSVTTGGSTTMRITVPAGTMAGPYQIQVNAASATYSRKAFFDLTVTAGAPCSGFANTRTGTVANGANVYQPGTGGFYAVAGKHTSCLAGPVGTDFDLFLQRWNGSTWVTLASSAGSGPNEAITYTGTSGYYRYRIHAYTGSGSYTLGYTAP